MCSLPLEHLVETMRPLPVAHLAGTPPYVLGVAIIRGGPVPVIDLDAFLGSPVASPGPRARFVLIRTGARHVALAVREVMALADVGGVEARLAPLLAGACQGAVESVAALDDELVMALRLARLVPEGVWAAVAARAGVNAGEGEA